MATKALTVKTSFIAKDKFSQTMKKMTSSVSRFVKKTQAGFARATRTMRSMQRVTGGLVKKMFNLRNAAGVMVAGLAIKKIADTAIAVGNIGDEAAKTSRQIGITAETLQELRFAADRQGVSSESLTKSLQLLNRNIGDVQMGQGTLTTMLKRTNPELLKQLKGVKNNEQAFDLITKAISNMPNQLQKASLAQAAFGRSGQDMLKLLEIGPKGLQKLREEAKKFGGIISNESAAKMEEFIDAQTNMKFALQGLKITIGTELIPVVQKAMENITKWTMENKEFIKIKVAAFLTGFIEKAKWIKDNFTKVAGAVKTFAIAIGTLITVNTVLNSVMAITNAIAAANPFVWIGLAVVALIAVIALLVKNWKNIVNWVKTSNNVFAKLIRVALTPLMLLIDNIKKSWNALKAAFKSGGIWGAIKQIGKSILSFLLLPLESVLKVANQVTGGRIGGQALETISSFREGLNSTEGEVIKKTEQTKNEKVNIQVSAAQNTEANIIEDTTNQVQLTPNLGWT